MQRVVPTRQDVRQKRKKAIPQKPLVENAFIVCSFGGVNFDQMLPRWVGIAVSVQDQGPKAILLLLVHVPKPKKHHLSESLRGFEAHPKHGGVGNIRMLIRPG
jgi:uncharacterized linocin/CFP29 family protein